MSNRYPYLGVLLAGAGFWQTAVSIKGFFNPVLVKSPLIAFISGLFCSILMFQGIAMIYLAKRD